MKYILHVQIKGVPGGSEGWRGVAAAPPQICPKSGCHYQSGKYMNLAVSYQCLISTFSQMPRRYNLF